MSQPADTHGGAPGRAVAALGARSLEASMLLTADQVAGRWQVPKSQVYRLVREDRLPAVKVGRYYRFRVDVLERWELESGAVGC